MADAPVLRVIGGDATAEEIAALVAVLTAAAAGPRPGAPAARAGRPRPVWNDRAAQLRRPFGHGPGAWRRNARRGIV
jgi:hypothetical protein